MESPLFCLQPTRAYQRMHQPRVGWPHAKGYQQVDHGHRRN